MLVQDQNNEDLAGKARAMLDGLDEDDDDIDSDTNA